MVNTSLETPFAGHVAAQIDHGQRDAGLLQFAQHIVKRDQRRRGRHLAGSLPFGNTKNGGNLEMTLESWPLSPRWSNGEIRALACTPMTRARRWQCGRRPRFSDAIALFFGTYRPRVKELAVDRREDRGT
jgi:hypothetical protein